MASSQALRAPKSAVLAFARSRVGVPVYVLFFIPLFFAALVALLSVSVPAQLAFLGALHGLEPELNQTGSAPLPPANQSARAAAAHGLAAARAAAESAARASVPRCTGRGQAGSFVLMFMGHSGSTAMISALQQHSAVAVKDYEPLDHGERAGDVRAALAYADAFFSLARAEGRVGGFKLRPRHLLKAPEKWAALFRRHGTRVIWNFRGNVFKQAVGHYPIRFLNDSSRYEGLGSAGAGSADADRVKRFRIHDMQALHTLLLDRIRGETHVEIAVNRAARGACVLPVAYEAFLRDPAAQTLRMQAFLGVSLAEHLAPRRRKATGDNLCDVVRNWDEVCAAFYGCREWRALMEDLDNGCSCNNMPVTPAARWHRFCFQADAASAFRGSGFTFRRARSR